MHEICLYAGVMWKLETLVSGPVTEGVLRGSVEGEA